MLTDGDDLRQAMASGRVPAVFRYQPTRFTVLPSERLSEWERLVREHVGLPGARFDQGLVPFSGTTSSCGDGECLDDSTADLADAGAGEYSPTDAPVDGRLPAVFQFQPTRMDVVPAERLEEWEQGLRRHVGMPVSDIAQAPGTLTGCHCGPDSCQDDEDFLPASTS